MYGNSTGEGIEQPLLDSSEMTAHAGHRPANGAMGVLADVSVSGDTYAPNLTTSGTRSTGAQRVQPELGRKPNARQPVVAPKVKHACNALFSACIDNLYRALNHAEDFFARNNAVEQLRDALAELWQKRNAREEPFAEIVNLLQGIFVERKVEDFSSEQLSVLRSVFEKLRAEPVLDDDFANGITLDLLNGGIDAFRELE